MKKRALSNLAMSFMAAVLCFGAAGARAGGLNARAGVDPTAPGLRGSIRRVGVPR